jgi:4'-phosphopantetheinyl transferase
MPLILHKAIENGVIGLWKISEEVDELYQLSRLSDPDQLTYAGISSLHRKKEWLATRALLNNLTGEPVRISYHEDGRPYPEKGEFKISISHTSGFVTILLHQKSIPGIDIELTNRQVGKVASRFLSSEELDACRESSEYSNRQLLLHWCAKEAVFKMVPFSNIEFSTDIRIKLNDVSHDSGSFHGIFNTKDDQVLIPLNYLINNGVVIVWGSVDQIKFSI